MSWKDKHYCQANVYQKEYPNRLKFLIQVCRVFSYHDILRNINGKHKIIHKSIRLIFDPFNKNIKSFKCKVVKNYITIDLKYKTEELEKLKLSLKN